VELQEKLERLGLQDQEDHLGPEGIVVDLGLLEPLDLLDHLVLRDHLGHPVQKVPLALLDLLDQQVVLGHQVLLDLEDQQEYPDLLVLGVRLDKEVKLDRLETEVQLVLQALLETKAKLESLVPKDHREHQGLMVLLEEKVL